MDKKQLKKIRKSIVRSKDLVTIYGQPKELSKAIVFHANCYAYALGIMELAYNHFYNPGFTEYSPIQTIFGRSTEVFLKRIFIDLKNLKIKYRKIEIGESIKLAKNEYLIKVFYNVEKGIDFHFIRQDPRTELWFHKVAWNQQPCLVQNGVEIGIDPDEITSINGDVKYSPICYIAIREK